MSIVYLNGQFLPMQEAHISPMDRGFLFGDGIYEVIPSYAGRMVGFADHLDRMEGGLALLGISCPQIDWRGMCEELMQRNGSGNLGLYIHVSRGADQKRFHAYPDPKIIAPTVYAFAFEIPAEPSADPLKAKQYRCGMTEDMRWRRCHIKSTALLGNVMHFQQGREAGFDEMILHNANGEITEASSCNVFIVVDGTVITPPLDNQLLPGITRKLILDILRKDGSIAVAEKTISAEQLLVADEVWVTSSSKEIVPVVEVAGNKIGSGRPGPVWAAAQNLFTLHKYEY
jgi:D-alanine transaminase